jgi:hypothetical protein
VSARRSRDRTRAAPVLLLALVALAAGCSRPAATAGDTIVLVASRSLADSDRAAALLERLAASTDVLGPARFELVSEPEAGPQDFARLVAGRSGAGGLRTVIALLGDLSVLQDVDPSILNRAPATLTSRVVDYVALDAAVEQLVRAAGQRGGRLVLASAPLGRQGRVEVPELLDVGGHFAKWPGFIDLQAVFRPHEARGLFSNGIDRLDAAGQVVLARALFAALCADPGPVAPRDGVERRARAQARALRGLAEGRRAEAAEALASARQQPLGDAPASPAETRAALRDAALALALEGPEAAAKPWSRLDAAASTPGLALTGRLITQQAGGPLPEEPFEVGLVAVLDAVRARDPQAARQAKQLVADHPQRLEAWMLLELAGIVASPPTEVRDEARAALARDPDGLVPAEAAAALLDDWPRCLNVLPALYLAQQPFAEPVR